jgi:small nuclear ribonucleoprotein (snRNP)-like protein
MFYQLEEKLGTTVTVRVIGGEEFVGKLLAVDGENEVLTLSRPRTVLMMENEVYMVPFALTSAAEEAVINMRVILSVVETLEETAADYQDLVNSDTAQAA